jgi:hypothetical protein
MSDRNSCGLLPLSSLIPLFIGKHWRLHSRCRRHSTIKVRTVRQMQNAHDPVSSGRRDDDVVGSQGVAMAKDL